LLKKLTLKSTQTHENSSLQKSYFLQPKVMQMLLTERKYWRT